MQRAAQTRQGLRRQHDLGIGAGMLRREAAQDIAWRRQAALRCQTPAGLAVRGKPRPAQIGQQAEQQRCRWHPGGGQDRPVAKRRARALKRHRSRECPQIQPGLRRSPHAKRGQRGRRVCAHRGPAAMPRQPDRLLLEQHPLRHALFQHHGAKQPAGQPRDKHPIAIVQRHPDAQRLVGFPVDHHPRPRRHRMIALHPQGGKPHRQIGVTLLRPQLDVVEHRMKGGIQGHRVQDLRYLGGPCRLLIRGEFHLHPRVAALAAQHGGGRQHDR